MVFSIVNWELNIFIIFIHTQVPLLWIFAKFRYGNEYKGEEINLGLSYTIKYSNKDCNELDETADYFWYGPQFQNNIQLKWCIKLLRTHY